MWCEDSLERSGRTADEETSSIPSRSCTLLQTTRYLREVSLLRIISVVNKRNGISGQTQGIFHRLLASSTVPCPESCSPVNAHIYKINSSWADGERGRKTTTLKYDILFVSSIHHSTTRAAPSPPVPRQTLSSATPSLLDLVLTVTAIQRFPFSGAVATRQPDPKSQRSTVLWGCTYGRGNYKTSSPRAESSMRGHRCSHERERTQETSSPAQPIRVGIPTSSPPSPYLQRACDPSKLTGSAPTSLLRDPAQRTVVAGAHLAWSDFFLDLRLPGGYQDEREPVPVGWGEGSSNESI